MLANYTSYRLMNRMNTTMIVGACRNGISGLSDRDQGRIGITRSATDLPTGFPK
jgi:hypothetical protein